MEIGGHQVNDAMFSYIAQNATADCYKLLLKDEPNLSFDKSFAVTQIECRRKTKDKLSEILANDHFLFPTAISAEQCTHEIVAKFHASLFSPGDKVLDMTMGLGVDSYYISQQVAELTCVELNPLIASVGKHNFSLLNPKVKVINGNSADYITSENMSHYDAIFIDPARREETGKRVHGFDDCQPKVLELIPYIARCTNKLYIKASPMLDVTQAIRVLGMALSHVWAVSVKNECKELLFCLDFKSGVECIIIHALNYYGKWDEFVIGDEEASVAVPSLSPRPEHFLYEPNASIMKLGCYDAVAGHFGISPISTNSHLFVSEKPIEDFPGRVFKINDVIQFKEREFKHLRKRYKKANVTTRNFAINAQQLKRRLRLDDGGDVYIFGTTLSSGEMVLLITEKFGKS